MMSAAMIEDKEIFVKDLIAVPENAEILNRRYPDRVTVATIENAGHTVLNEKPDEVAKCIAEYLRASDI